MEFPEEAEILFVSRRAEQEGGLADTAAQSGQRDDEGGEDDDDGETQDDPLADEILGHVARLRLNTVTCRQIAFQYDGRQDVNLSESF